MLLQNFFEQMNYWQLVLLFLVPFAFTLLIVPLIVIQLPSDYFYSASRRRHLWEGSYPLLRLLMLVGKNLCGYLFILMGIAMLILPGQGLLTILIGVLMLDFPGKFRLERWLVSKPPVHRSMNWLRRKWGRQPIQLDQKSAGE